MEVNSQAVIEDLLEQNKQYALQLAIARTLISQLNETIKSLSDHHHDHDHDDQQG
jgi:hypothetical protein